MIQKLRGATSLFASNLGLFSAIVLTVWLPASILLVYLRLYVLPETSGGDEFRLITQELRISNAIELAFGPLYVGATLYAASRLQQGLRATYKESMAHGARRSFKLLVTRIVAGLIMLVGFLALVIPGLVLALRFALLDAVVVLEGVEGLRARERSAQLTQGKRWHILGTMVLTFIGVFLAVFLVSFVLYFPLALLGQDENFASAVLTECFTNVMLTIPTLVLFLFYWEATHQQND